MNYLWKQKQLLSKQTIVNLLYVINNYFMYSLCDYLENISTLSLLLYRIKCLSMWYSSWQELCTCLPYCERFCWPLLQWDLLLYVDRWGRQQEVRVLQTPAGKSLFSSRSSAPCSHPAEACLLWQTFSLEHGLPVYCVRVHCGSRKEKSIKTTITSHDYIGVKHVGAQKRPTHLWLQQQICMRIQGFLILLLFSFAQEVNTHTSSVLLNM